LVTPSRTAILLDTALAQWAYAIDNGSQMSFTPSMRDYDAFARLVPLITEALEAAAGTMRGQVDTATLPESMSYLKNTPVGRLQAALAALEQA
jgi:hypothetical protein